MRAVLVNALALIVVVKFADSLGLQRKRIQTRETNSCMERQATGTICESCDLLATCVKLATGWVNIPVESCDTRKGFYCNANLGACSNLTGPCHPFGFEGNFPCTTQGIFPDPYDCQRYHMCYFVESTLVSAAIDCGADKAFNAANGQCSLTLNDDVCHEKRFVCQKAGEAHPWPNNPNIFYVCKATSNEEMRILYPTLYRCDPGEVFNGYHCISIDSEPVEGPSNDGETSVAPAEEGGIGLITTTVKTIDNFKCTRKGLMADIKNCRSYYFCSGAGGSPIHNTCPRGTYYKKTISSCTPGSCNDN